MADSPTDNDLEALAFEAPYLIERLLKNRVVETEQEGCALFLEVKRYIVFSNAHSTMTWDIQSLRVDEVWHQFVLYTREYIDFSFRYFGRYVQHSPGNSPELGRRLDSEDPPIKSSTFEDFRTGYEEFFGTPLPDVWYDWKNVSLHSRLINEKTADLSVRSGSGLVHLRHASGGVLLSVNELAKDALAFIAGTPGFYVRELPGELSENEKIELAAILVKHKLLKSAA